MTENNLEATAEAAINVRIVNRKIPLVFLPVLPLKKGSAIVSAIVDVVGRKSCRRRIPDQQLRSVS
jgi:hypothetical protein